MLLKNCDVCRKRLTGKIINSSYNKKVLPIRINNNYDLAIDGKQRSGNDDIGAAFFYLTTAFIADEGSKQLGDYYG
jgi:hypothetical protein